MGAFPPNEKMLSKRFSLSDLTITDQKSGNNPDKTALQNLYSLAALLDLAYDNIGKFKIISAYRSQDTQDALKNSGNNQAVSKSLHTLGQAADIMPTGISAEAYMAKILASPLREKFGQIALKKTVLHISVPIPAKNFVGTPMLVLADGKYYRQTEEWAKNLKDKYGYAVKVLKETAEKASEVVTSNPVKTSIGIGALVLGVAFLAAMSSGKRTA